VILPSTLDGHRGNTSQYKTSQVGGASVFSTPRHRNADLTGFETHEQQSTTKRIRRNAYELRRPALDPRSRRKLRFLCIVIVSGANYLNENR
jgi:hypothetical protein